MDLSKPQQRYPISFTGTGAQFFKIWIVNILLTIVTLYIYSAWAKVRTKRYFHGNTVLDGSSFDYHASPLQILLSRLVAALLFVAVTAGGIVNPLVPSIATVVLFLVLPWAIWRSTKFNMRMTSYRNVRFDFDGALWPLYLYQMVLPLIMYAVSALAFYLWHHWELSPQVLVTLVVVVLALNIILVAFTHEKLSSYFLDGYRYGKSRFSSELSLGSFFKIYGMATLLAVVTLALLLISLSMFYWPEGVDVLDELKHIDNTSDGEAPEDVGDAALFFMFDVIPALFLYLAIVGYYVAALVRARVRNHVFANTLLDKRVSFVSDIKTTSLWWVMFSNLLLILVSLGLAIPFAQVRIARLLARHSTVVSNEPLDDFVGEKREQVSAFGDELGDVFDLDMDVGI
ncbi:MAG: YjgN family protein [Granulosicoccus sp.]